MIDPLLSLMDLPNCSKLFSDEPNLRRTVQKSMLYLAGHSSWRFVGDVKVQGMEQDTKSIEMKQEETEEKTINTVQEIEQPNVTIEMSKEKTVKIIQETEEAKLRIELIKEKTAKSCQEAEDAKLRIEIANEENLRVTSLTLDGTDEART